MAKATPKPRISRHREGDRLMPFWRLDYVCHCGLGSFTRPHAHFDLVDTHPRALEVLAHLAHEGVVQWEWIPQP